VVEVMTSFEKSVKLENEIETRKKELREEIQVPKEIILKVGVMLK
jgi:hypothetical protein